MKTPDLNACENVTAIHILHFKTDFVLVSKLPNYHGYVILLVLKLFISLVCDLGRRLLKEVNN